MTKLTRHNTILILYIIFERPASQFSKRDKLLIFRNKNLKMNCENSKNLQIHRDNFEEYLNELSANSTVITQSELEEIKRNLLGITPENISKNLKRRITSNRYVLLDGANDMQYVCSLKEKLVRKLLLYIHVFLIRNQARDLVLKVS